VGYKNLTVFLFVVEVFATLIVISFGIGFVCVLGLEFLLGKRLLLASIYDVAYVMVIVSVCREGARFLRRHCKKPCT